MNYRNCAYPCQAQLRLNLLFRENPAQNGQGQIKVVERPERAKKNPALGWAGPLPLHQRPPGQHLAANGDRLSSLAQVVALFVWVLFDVLAAQDQDAGR